MKRFSGLIVNGSVLNLKQNIRGEFPIKRLQFVICRGRTIMVSLRVIDKCPPDNNTVVWRHSGGQHVRTLCVASVIRSRSWLSLAVRFDQKTTEIRDHLVNLVCFPFPPLCDLAVQWVGRFQLTKLDRRGESGREIDSNAIWPEYASDC